MEFRSFTSTLFVLMSLVSSNAWGKTLDEASWRESILDECSNVYSVRLGNGRVELPRDDRESLARAVCSDARVFWSFAHVARPESAEQREAQYRRASENENGPMVIGIRGQTARDTSIALHALRDLLFVNSDTLLEWTRDQRQVEDWASAPSGGAWGGLVFVNFEKANRAQQMYKGERLHEAFDYMSNHGMSASVLVVSAVGDAAPETNGLPVHWAETTGACAFAL